MKNKLILITIFLLMLSSALEAKHFTGAPSINGARIIGNYPSTPFLFYIPTTGERPITWSAENLPNGLSLDKYTGIITGTVDAEGDYKVKLTAANSLGKNSKELTISIGDKLLLTPPMGWNSWNTFGQNLTESLIIDIADVMIKNGMRDQGYTYINIDDFWQLAERGEDGHLQINREKFPNGIKYLSDYLHARGFKIGVYSDAAEQTCGGVAGSYGYEEVDAKDFASWGVDLLKYDYCHAPDPVEVAIERYTTMGNALKNSERSIVFSICEWGPRKPWLWGKQVGGHYWRTTFDIRDKWHTDEYSHTDNGILNIIDINAQLDQYAEPGAWNDPDMLVVGILGSSAALNYKDVDNKGCTNNQYRAHMSMWAMFASPLLAGNDIRNMNEETRTTLTNANIIAINQDALGVQAKRIVHNDQYDIYLKPLADGTTAIACLNRTNKAFDVELDSKVANVIKKETMFCDAWTDEVQTRNKKGLKSSLEAYECKVYILK